MNPGIATYELTDLGDIVSPVLSSLIWKGGMAQVLITQWLLLELIFAEYLKLRLVLGPVQVFVK